MSFIRIFFHLTTISAGERSLREMEEFGQLPMAAQRYIRRSLQVRFEHPASLAELARSAAEANSIARQISLYGQIDAVIEAIPVDDDIASVTRFTSLIAPLVAFDMAEGKLESFAAFGFLYERLLGAAARPWLPAVFMLIASLPDLNPNRRLSLLASVTADAVTPHWSNREPQFFPEWIEDISS
jgi:hypothetical protein